MTAIAMVNHLIAEQGLTGQMWIQLFSPLVHLIAIVASACLILIQIRKNHESSLRLQRENEKRRLKLDLYNRLADQIESASQKIMEAMGAVQNIPLSLRSNQIYRENTGKQPPPIEHRRKALLELHMNALESVNVLSISLERYEIAIPAFRIFVKAFGHQIEQCSEAFKVYYEKVIPYLPFEVDEAMAAETGLSGTIVPETPCLSDIKHLDELAHLYTQECLTQGAFLRDLSIEAQNTLLEELFEKPVPPRQPPSDEAIVIGTDEKTRKALEARFSGEESGGTRNAQDPDAEREERRTER